MKLVNSYAALGKSFYKDSHPAHFDNPTLALWNHDLANELLISDTLQADSDTLAAIFSGQEETGDSVLINYHITHKGKPSNKRIFLFF